MLNKSWNNYNDGKDISRLPEDQQYALIGHKKNFGSILNYAHEIKTFTSDLNQILQCVRHDLKML